jgi:ectoine hydroxylase
MQDLYPSRRSTRAEILPRVDPVVYSRWTPAAPLSEAQTRQFSEQGFLLLDNLFSSDEVRCLQADTRQMLDRHDHLDPTTIVTEPGDNDAVRSIFRIHEQSEAMARFIADPRLVEIARFLLGDEVYIHQSRLNYKPGFRGKEFYWHSDFETWHVEDGMPRMRALSMSVLLASNTPHNGPVMLMPGSHRKFVSCIGETPENHYLTSLKKQEIGVPDEEHLEDLADEHGIVAPVGEPGAVLVFDCNTMHGSNSNITPSPRSNAFFVFNAVQNRLVRPFGRTGPRPRYIAAREQRPVGAGLHRRMENF